MANKEERIVIYMESDIFNALKLCAETFNMTMSELGRIGIMALLKESGDAKTFYQYVSDVLIRSST